jgi:hypothetical protein
MYTEKEAGKKWCPETGMADFYPGRGAPFESTGTEDITTCIGSQCMWWRWISDYDKQANPCKSKTHGYCGLAGKP